MNDIFDRLEWFEAIPLWFAAAAISVGTFLIIVFLTDRATDRLFAVAKKRWGLMW